MHEREIFLAAVEITDPTQRAAYLDQACTGDAALRAQVEELLAAHEQSSQFLETPAAGQESSADPTLLADSSSPTPVASETERGSGEAEFRRFLAPSTRPGWLGRLAHYEIEQILGRGAFGIVAKAFDEKLHRVVAIKLMSPELASTSPPRKRFLREARTAAAVTHENIVAIYAVEEEPIPYLVMEYIAGQTLLQRMDAQGPLELPEVLRIGQQIAAGLAAAHAAQLIHRDIKPANILLTGGIHDRAKISDFGLARAVDDASMTTSGVIVGTPMYMAPEQARGEVLDHRADLFSLGSVMYRMASGRPPFRASNTIAVLKRVCEDTPRPLSDVTPEIPAWLEGIIFKLLEKKREDRFQTAQEVADLLARCRSELEHQGRVTSFTAGFRTEETQAVTPVRPAASRSRPLPRSWLVAGVIALALTAGWRLWTTNGGLRPAVSEGSLIAEPTATTGIPAPAAVDTIATSWHGWPADAPKPAIAPFDAAQAKRHQEEWAAYLKVPVEYTNTIGMKFRLIPPGEFMMGSTAEEIEAAIKDVGDDNHWKECIESEAPQHQVILTQPIYLGVNEVTQAEYEKVLGLNPSHFASTGEGKDAVAGLQTAEHPVENVSWNDAAEFCSKLSQQEKLKPTYFRAGDTITPLDGSGYRLPSEAEWEFACRAGTETKYSIGDKDEDLARAGWFDGNSGSRTHAVGELKTNPFSLADLHGNVWEWVQDGWDATLYTQSRIKPAVNPNSTVSVGSQAVARGGCYMDGRWSAGRSAGRRAHNPKTRGGFQGFRVSLPVDAVRQSLNTNGPTLPARDDNIDAMDPVAERAAAEWVLSVGGTLILDKLDGSFLPLNTGRLPDEPFGIYSVAITGNKSLKDDDLARLSRCRRLQTLNLSYNALNGSGLRHLKSCPTLVELSIAKQDDGRSLTDESLAALAALTHVETLNIGWNSALTDASLAIIARLTHLRELDVDHCQFTDDGLKQLDQLKELNSFHCAHSALVTDRGVEHMLTQHSAMKYMSVVDDTNSQRTLLPLTRGRSLETIALSGNQMTSAGAAILTAMPNLQNLQIHLPTDAAVSRLALPHLKSLSLYWSSIDAPPFSDAGYQSVATSSELEKIVLEGVKWSPNDDNLRMLSKMPRLKLLSLQFDEQYHPRNYTPAGIEAFHQLRPDVELDVDGKLYAATGWHGWPADAPKPAIAPFDAEQAKQHQEEWAAYLKVPVEYTNSIGMKFRLLPPGEFMMGSTLEEIDAALKHIDQNDTRARDDLQSEAPRHQVILTQPMYFGVHEVTQAEYRRVTGTNPSHFSAQKEGKEIVAGLDTSNHPVEMVNWNDAADFCARLSTQEKLKPFSIRSGDMTAPQEGTGYRLPTEAEWEYACRAGTTTQCWIDGTAEDLLRAGWFAENGQGRTHPVGESRANPFGLCDLHGNVWEWTQDSWDPSWYSSLHGQSAVNPTSPFAVGSMRVVRGSHFWFHSFFSRASARHSVETPRGHGYLGFRVALTVDAVRQALRNDVSTAPTPASESLADFHARNRRAAEKVLAVGGDLSDVVVEIPDPFEWRTIRPGQALPDQPFVVRTWSVKNSTTVTNEDLEVLAGLRQVTTLNLMVWRRLDAGCLPRIAALHSSLKDLGIGNTSLKTSDLAQLPTMPHVHVLWISAEQVDDDWLFLDRFPGLRTLNVYGAPLPKLNLPARAVQLRCLWMAASEQPPTSTTVEELQTRLPHLRLVHDANDVLTVLGRDPAWQSSIQLVKAGLPVSYFTLDGRSHPVDQDATERPLAGRFFLTSIPRDVKLTNELLALLTDMDLQNLKAEGIASADLLAETLKDRQDLDHLSFANSDLTDQGLRSLQSLTALRSLNVTGTKVTPAAIAAFHRAAPGCGVIADGGEIAPDYLAVATPANP